MYNPPEWYIKFITNENYYTIMLVTILLLILFLINTTFSLIKLSNTNDELLKQNIEINKNLEIIEKQLFIINDNMKAIEENTEVNVISE